MRKLVETYRVPSSQGILQRGYKERSFTANIILTLLPYVLCLTTASTAAAFGIGSMRKSIEVSATGTVQYGLKVTCRDNPCYLTADVIPLGQELTGKTVSVPPNPNEQAHFQKYPHLKNIVLSPKYMALYDPSKPSRLDKSDEFKRLFEVTVDAPRSGFLTADTNVIIFVTQHPYDPRNPPEHIPAVVMFTKIGQKLHIKSQAVAQPIQSSAKKTKVSPITAHPLPATVHSIDITARPEYQDRVILALLIRNDANQRLQVDLTGILRANRRIVARIPFRHQRDHETKPTDGFRPWVWPFHEVVFYGVVPREVPDGDYTLTTESKFNSRRQRPTRQTITITGNTPEQSSETHNEKMPLAISPQELRVTPNERGAIYTQFMVTNTKDSPLQVIFSTPATLQSREGTTFSFSPNTFKIRPNKKQRVALKFKLTAMAVQKLSQNVAPLTFAAQVIYPDGSEDKQMINVHLQ